MYGFIYSIVKSKKDSHETTYTKDEFKILGKKVYGTSVQNAASLVFASVGAGIGATLIRPSTGQWVGMTPLRFMMIIDHIHKYVRLILMIQFCRVCAWGFRRPDYDCFLFRETWLGTLIAHTNG